MDSRLRIAVMLFLASIVFQSSFITLDAFSSDEGIVLVAADDVARGKLLYQDVYIPVTPAVYLLQGLAFKIFGSQFFVSRMLMCVVYALSVAMVYVLAACYLPPRKAAFAGALAIPLQVWMWPHAHFFSYNALAILFCLIAIRLAWSIEVAENRRRSAFWFGVALAAGLWTKPNLLAAIGAGVLLYWLSGWLRTSLGLGRERDRGFYDLLTEGVATLVGIAVASLPVVLYLAATGILDDMLFSLYALTRIYGDVPTGLFPSLFPLTGQIDALRMNSGLMMPGMIRNALATQPAYQYLVDFSGWIDLAVRFLYYAPLLLLVATAFRLLRSNLRRRWSISNEAALLSLFTGAVLLLTIAPHPAVHYMIPNLLPLIGLAVALLHTANPGQMPLLRGIGRTLAVAIAGLYFTVSFAALFVYVSIPRAPVETPNGTYWVTYQTARLWLEVLDFTESNVSADEHVFVVPYFPLYYFMSGQEHPSRYVDLRPGSPGVAAEDGMMLQLERDDVEWVFYAKGAQYPGLERFATAYPRLNRYIERHFDVVEEFTTYQGVYAEMRRRRR